MESNETSQTEQSPFKAFEKRIRGCQHLSDVLDHCDVLDFLDPTASDTHKELFHCAGKVSVSGDDKPFYVFSGYEGLFVIPDCLPAWQQVEIAHFALNCAPTAPNNTNLTQPEVQGVWSKEKHLYDAMGPSPESFHTLPKAHVLGRLRWASLGFQYDWTNRRYPQAADPQRSSNGPNIHIGVGIGDGKSLEKESAPCGDSPCSRIPPVFPPHLASLIRSIVCAIPPSANLPTGTPITIEPEASIVNYFPAGTTMGGHVDDAELTYEHPVVSLSIGKSCVFLIGGLTKESEAPLALVLRSGYVLLMHGESRLRMHGVAKVFPCPCGDARRSKKVAGAAKKPKWNADYVPCECACSSFDAMLEPSAIAEDMVCHEDLCGADCSTHYLPIIDREDQMGSGDNQADIDQHHLQVEQKQEQLIGASSSKCPSCSRPVLSPLELQRVLKYMKTSRVNINVRQVYPTGTRPSFV